MLFYMQAALKRLGIFSYLEKKSYMRRGHLFIEGKVQGVGFRHFTKLNAREVGVYGWVKNLPDGRVEAVFEGPEDHIIEIVSRCEDGPGASRIDDVDFEWEDPAGAFSAFKVKYF